MEGRDGYYEAITILIGENGTTVYTSLMFWISTILFEFYFLIELKLGLGIKPLVQNFRIKLWI